MCLSKSDIAKRIFQSVNGALKKYEIPWVSCTALGIDNTSVSVGKHKSLIAEVQKKNPSVKLRDAPVILPIILPILLPTSLNRKSMVSRKNLQMIVEAPMQ